MKIILEIPGALDGADVIAKVAKLRKAQAQSEARKRQGTVAIDTKLPDEEYLKTALMQSIVDDYKLVVTSEAAHKAKLSASEEFDTKLKGKK